MMQDDSRLGATLDADGVTFAVWTGAAERLWVCLFSRDGARETGRVEMVRGDDGVFSARVPGLRAGARYGFRAHGPWAPWQGQWFDPAKLLMDPYAVAIDRPYRYDPRLAAPRADAVDTAPLMPKAVVTRLPAPLRRAAPRLAPGGLIYEVAVRAFTMRHPGVPEEKRGTVAALAEPAVIEHLQALGVSAVELMPVVAWIDERHLGPLGLTNAWGYNPVSFMALEPRLVPGGIAELRRTVAALHRAGIGVILDLVFNHTGESDMQGPTLSLRGLDGAAYFRRAEDGGLVNDTGTGNTVACDNPAAMRLVLDSLRHFVCAFGVDGFRFDLATVLGRRRDGFDPAAPLLVAIAADPLLADRVLIAEPWDIGPGGYQLGRFPAPFLEWNDRYRDDLRRFFRGDKGTLGALATRLAGSSDLFSGAPASRSVNFLAAHDGFSLGDVVRYGAKHNEANGEDNRDGHNENFSWNNGVEGPSEDAGVVQRRRRDVKAMLTALFLSRGTPMLAAGDEFGRSQNGNNNAYAQDNASVWLGWEGRDAELEAYACALAKFRRDHAALLQGPFLTGEAGPDGFPDVAWLTETGRPMTADAWQDPERSRLLMVLAAQGRRVALAVNGDRRACVFSLPGRDGFVWRHAAGDGEEPFGEPLLAGRTCLAFYEARR